MNHSFVMCMAGDGTRFRHPRLRASKPFLKLHGLSLLEVSLRCLPLRSSDQLIVIHRLEGTELSQLYQICDHLDISDIVFKKLSQPTRGQLETASLSENLVKHSSLSIFNCDTSFECRTLDEKVHSRNMTQSWVPCAPMPGSAWSFFRTTEDDLRVLEAAEKKPISPWASVGYYHFHNTEMFFRSAFSAIQQSDGRELYIAPLYNNWIQKNQHVEVIPCEAFRPLGTPEQIECYGDITWSEFIRENSVE